MGFNIQNEDIPNGTNSESRTMGASSSRKILCSAGESKEGRINTKRDVKPLLASNRLVRHELLEEVQRGVHNEGQVRNRLFVVQESPESVQQEDVRPVL